jgi:hypothetical protein
VNNKDLIDLFAGLAMQGLLASARGIPAEVCAKAAYQLAYAMIEEKERRIERERPSQGD